MTSSQFIYILKQQLKNIPIQDLEEIISDYREHFRIGIEEGRSEVEIATSLGNPKTIAKEIKANYMINVVEEKYSTNNFLKAILMIISLSFFNLIFVLGPLVAIYASILAFYISGLALLLSGVAVFIGTFLQPYYPEYINLPFNPVISITVAVILILIGIIWTFGSYMLNKLLNKVTIKYLKLNLNIITNKRTKYDN